MPSHIMTARSKADDDAPLVAAARGGDADAFGRLVDRYRDRVYGVAFRIVGNADDAMDIAQEAFVKAWTSLPRFRDRSAFFTWIYRITTNLALDHLRRNRVRPVEYDDGILSEALPGLESAPSANPSPRQETMHAETRRAIEEALAQLTPEHRAVLVLREMEGRSYQEIAQTLGCRIGTVMSRLHYGRRRMRELLEEILR